MNYLEIKIQRIRMGYKMRDVAEMLGLNENTYRLKERGRAAFTIKQKLKLAKVLQFTTEQANDFIFDGNLVEIRDPDSGAISFALKLPE